MISRRKLFTTTALGVILFATGCAGTATSSPAPSISDLVANATAIVTGLSNFIPSVNGLLPPNTMAQVQGWLAQAKGLVTAISGMTAPNTATITSFASIVGNIVTTLGGNSTTATIAQGVVGAVQTLLPIILSLAGVALAGPAATGMTPEQARAYLLAIR